MNKLLAEFTGTFLFCSVALLTGNPLSAGLALAALVYALAYLSGGHFNPAVSIAVWLRGQMDKSEMLKYVAVQAGGGLAASLLWVMLSDASVPVHSPQIPASFRAFLGETCFTFFIAFAYLHVRTARQQLGNVHYGAVVGMAHAAGSAAIFRLSAGACNPALGLALVLSGWVSPAMIVVYLLSGLIGGAAAAVAYRLLNPND